MLKKNKLNSKSFSIKLVLPAFIMICLFHVIPLAEGIGYAFTSYRLDKPGKTKFIFLENFIDILTSDDKFYESLGFTFICAIGIVVLAFLFGFGIALLLNTEVPGRGVFRSLILIPWVISSSVTGTNWKWILNDQYGIVNRFLMNIHLVDEPILFLANPRWAQFTVIFVGAWKQLPFMTIVILAALQSISPDLYEAASIDGAGFFQKLKYITLPGISSVTIMCTTLEFIWRFNDFESVYLMTEGGPNKATYTLPIYIYNTAFGRSNVSYASAVAVLVLVAMVIFTVVRFKLQGKGDD